MRGSQGPGGCRRSPRRGAAAAELAVILIPLIVAALGCVDFGRFAYTYICVTNAARAGAGWASMNSPSMSSSTAAWKTSVQTAATNEWSGSSGLDADSTKLTVTVANPISDSGGLQRAEVTASYSFTLIVPWPGLPKTMTLQDTCEVRIIR